MNLNQAKSQVWYAVEEIATSSDNELKSRFSNFGVLPGSKILIKRKAPIFKDPLLIQTEDSQIAITKFEAAHVQIKELA